MNMISFTNNVIRIEINIFIFHYVNTDNLEIAIISLNNFKVMFFKYAS